MPSLEELERRLDALSAENATLRRRLTDLEESVDSHVGIDYGAAQQLAPHPSMQVSVAEYGGGVMRLDESGIQIKANNTVDLPALWLVPELRSDPENSDQYAGVSGDASTSDNYVRLTARAVPTGVVRLAKLTVYAEGGNAYTENFAAHGSVDATRWNGADYIGLTVGEFSTGFSAVYIENAPLKLGTGAADPGTTLQDAMVWYLSTTDKYRARANGVTENLAFESWVTANFVSGGTQYAHSLMLMGA